MTIPTGQISGRYVHPDGTTPAVGEARLQPVKLDAVPGVFVVPRTAIKPLDADGTYTATLATGEYDLTISIVGARAPLRRRVHVTAATPIHSEEII